MAFRVIELTDGNDTLSVGPGMTGMIFGLGGSDNITVTGRLTQTANLNLTTRDEDGLPLQLSFDWSPGSRSVHDSLTFINPGPAEYGDPDYDTVTLAGYGLVVDSVASNWAPTLIDARRAMQAVINVGNDDTILGANNPNAVVIVTGLAKGVDFLGRGGHDIVMLSDGAQIWGGGGNDFLQAGNYARINGGVGNDTLSVGSSGRVHGMEGNDLITQLGVNALATGGAGKDTISSSLKITALGGAGNDALSSSAEGSLLDGGDGNDYIRGNGQVTSGHTRHYTFTTNYSGGDGILKGGAGDDRLVMDAGDRAHGGTGVDNFIAFERPGDAGTIFDFNATAGETIKLWLDQLSAAADFSDVEVREANGNTIIRQDGQVVLQIMGAVGLDVGLVHGHTEDDITSYYYTDLLGNLVQQDTLDVMIDVYEDYWT